MITEDHLEQLCLDWFRAQGYIYAYGPDIVFDGVTSASPTNSNRR